MSTDVLNSFCQTVESDCYFSKIRILDRHIASIFDTTFKNLKLSPHQFNVLVTIQSMGHYASAKLISKYLKMEKSTVSRDLKSLSKKGFILEEIDQLDSRKKSLSLTKLGRGAVIDCKKSWQEAQLKVKSMLEINSIVLKTTPIRQPAKTE